MGSFSRPRKFYATFLEFSAIAHKAGQDLQERGMTGAMVSTLCGGRYAVDTLLGVSSHKATADQVTPRKQQNQKSQASEGGLVYPILYRKAKADSDHARHNQ